jgi:hypothetical protein
MSLLPQQILPQDTPFGRASPDGMVKIDHDWWLLLYNLCQQVLGTSGAIPISDAELLSSTDSDAADVDAVVLRRRIDNALLLAQQDSPTNADDLPDIARSLLLAQDALIPDPIALAQPVASISPGGSPFTYTASHAGFVVVAGGTVTSVAIVRQGTSTATGLADSIFPMSRGDQLVVGYNVNAPTMTFIPWSAQ